MTTTILPTLARAPALETIKLSEAIREGAKLRPQCYGAFFRNGRSCALGAAYEYLTGDNDPCKCELTLISRYGTDIRNRVIYMNDGGLLTRERIADMLEEEGL